MSLVRKKKKAESLAGVARHRKMNSAGSHTDFCLTADQRAAAFSDTISFGLVERVVTKRKTRVLTEHLHGLSSNYLRIYEVEALLLGTLAKMPISRQPQGFHNSCT